MRWHLVLLIAAPHAAFLNCPRRSLPARGLPAAPEPVGEAEAAAREPVSANAEVGILASAALVGAATGCGVSAFKLSIDFLEQASYDEYLRSAFAALGAWGATPVGSALVYASVPALGGAAVGALREAVPGFDDPAAQTAPRVAVARAVAAVATLGTGNSLGPEGPAVQLGDAVAAAVNGAQLIEGRQSSRSTLQQQRRQRLICGAGQAAGVAAGFSAPVAGIFYALEVSSRDGGNGPLVLPRSAVAATAVAAVLSALVSQDVLQVRLSLPSPEYASAAGLGTYLGVELPSYLGLGAVCGLVALALAEAIRAAERVWADGGPAGLLPLAARPAACGLLAGLAQT